MGNHTAGGVAGSDAKYNLTAILDLELPEIENVYIDKNDKLKEISISKLEAERLVISDSDDSKFKSIKHYFGDTGRGHGNGQLETINLGEEVKVSNLYIGSSDRLKKINYESSSEVVDELVINTEPTLEEVTIPSVDRFYLKKESIILDGSITSNCHTLRNNPNVFITHSSLITDPDDCKPPINDVSFTSGCESSFIDKCFKEKLESILDILDDVFLVVSDIKKINEKYADKLDISGYNRELNTKVSELERRIKEELASEKLNLSKSYQGKLLDLIEPLYNNLIKEASNSLDQRQTIAFSGFEFLNNYNELTECSNNTAKLIATWQEVSVLLPEASKFALFSPVTERIFSRCEGMISSTIRDMIGEMTDYEDVYVPPTRISIDRWIDEWDRNRDTLSKFFEL